jgi:hypothetical protein
MESNNIMGLVAAFIGVAIIIGIGAQILGNAVSDCTTFPDYSEGEVASVAITLGGNYTTDPTVSFSGGGGTLASGTVTTGAIANGVEILSVAIVSGGQGYTTAPAVSFDGGAPVTVVGTADATITSDVTQTGWAGECIAINTQTQTAFALLVIVLIVIAAVIILSVVKML